jgi:hypothetical protein
MARPSLPDPGPGQSFLDGFHPAVAPCQPPRRDRTQFAFALGRRFISGLLAGLRSGCNLLRLGGGRIRAAVSDLNRGWDLGNLSWDLDEKGPQMNLDDYLIQLDGGNTSAPDMLTLQPGFVKQLSDLFTDAEARGLERGGPLMCDRATRTFTLGEVAEGLKTSMNIPVTTHPGNFGDVHAHPSTSIGRPSGYCAHSMADLMNFSKTRGNPFWIQFVNSGPLIYAMVQVNGVSKWDDTIRAFLGARSQEKEDQTMAAVIKAAGGKPKWARKLEQSESDPARRERLYDKYKAKARVGALMQHLSVKHCAEFAQEYDFCFYTGSGETLTRTLAAKPS